MTTKTRPLSRSAIHCHALARATEYSAVCAILAAHNIDKWGRYTMRNDWAIIVADPRLVCLARQLAAATRAGL